METIETERLILRHFQKGDEYAMYKNWTQDERIAKYCTWYPHKSIEETRDFLNVCIDNPYCFAITLKGSDEVVGAVDVSHRRDNKEVEMGYLIMYDLHNQGYMSEAVKAFLEYLFIQGFETIKACHLLENPASGKVMQKCGMQYIGNQKVTKKFGSDELVEVKYYQINNPNK